MVRGTTPTLKFKTDADISEAEQIYITFQQAGSTVLEVGKERLEVSAKTLTLHLTQAETLKFKEAKPVKMQIRARFGDGNAIASGIMFTNSDEILKEGEI